VTGSLPDDLVGSAQLVSGSVASGSLAGTVVVQDATATQHGWALVPVVVLLVLAVVVTRLLLGVVRSLRTGDPFTTANARRLATLGTVIIVGGVLLPLVQAVAFQAVLEPLLLDAPPSWELDLHLWPALAGVLVGFLAEVFSRGARLREDVEGLV
jgi:nitrogen fixation/metabolism regulation signal transduction histidine kinase